MAGEALKVYLSWAGTKTRNRLEHSVIFRLFIYIFDLGLGIPKLKFLSLGQGTVWLRGEGSEKNKME